MKTLSYSIIILALSMLLSACSSENAKKAKAEEMRKNELADQYVRLGLSPHLIENPKLLQTRLKSFNWNDLQDVEDYRKHHGLAEGEQNDIILYLNHGSPVSHDDRLHAMFGTREEDITKELRCIWEINILAAATLDKQKAGGGSSNDRLKQAVFSEENSTFEQQLNAAFDELHEEMAGSPLDRTFATYQIVEIFYPKAASKLSEKNNISKIDADSQIATQMQAAADKAAAVHVKESRDSAVIRELRSAAVLEVLRGILTAE